MAVAAFGGTATSWALEAESSGKSVAFGRLEIPSDPALSLTVRALTRSDPDARQIVTAPSQKSEGYVTSAAPTHAGWISISHRSHVVFGCGDCSACRAVSHGGDSIGVRSGLLPAAFLAVIGYIAPSFYVGHRTRSATEGDP